MFTSVREFWEEITNYWGYLFDYVRHNYMFMFIFILLSSIPPILVVTFEDFLRLAGLSLLQIMVIYLASLLPMSFFGYIINSSILYFMETYDDPESVGFKDVRSILSTINNTYLSLKKYLKVTWAVNLPVAGFLAIIVLLLVSNLGVFGLGLSSLLMLILFYYVITNSFVYPILFLANSEYNYKQLREISQQINIKEFFSILPRYLFGLLPSIIIMLGIHTAQIFVDSLFIKISIIMIGFGIFKVGYLFISMVLFNVYMEEWASRHF